MSVCGHGNYCRVQNSRIITSHVLLSLYLTLWSKYEDNMILGLQTLKFLTFVLSDDKLHDKLHKTSAAGSKQDDTQHPKYQSKN